MIDDDMDRLFRTRLHQLLVDHFDTCECADMDPGDTAQLLLRGLLGELVYGAIAVQMPQDHFAAMCGEAHRLLRPEYEKNQRRRLREQSH